MPGGTKAATWLGVEEHPQPDLGLWRLLKSGNVMLQVLSLIDQIS
jgi:hypothetical protein